MGDDFKRPVRPGSQLPSRSLREMVRVASRPSQRVLVVGEAKDWLPSPGNRLPKGIPVDYRSIGDAMASIPLPKPGEDRGPQVLWTILVLPGSYSEEIRMKPNVSIEGLDFGSVIIGAPERGPRYDDGSGRRALIYMNHSTSVTNIVVAKNRSWRFDDYGFWNKDTYGLPGKPLPPEWGGPGGELTTSQDIKDKLGNRTTLDPSGLGYQRRALAVSVCRRRAWQGAPA